MSLRESTPGKGDGSRLPHFVHVKTARGENWHAHAAGRAQWFDCHPSKRTKPCLSKITDGALPCPMCDALAPLEVIGYMPLFREVDSRPCFVLLHEFAREVADRLRHHQRVIVGRGDEQSDGVYVVPDLNPLPKFETAVSWKRGVIDLTATLLRVWSLPALSEWYQRTHRTSDNPVPLPAGVAVREDGSPFSPTMQNAAKRAGAPVTTDADANELFAAAVKRMTGEPSTNGKHARPKG